MTAKKHVIKSDLARLRAMKDEDIDVSDIPELDDAFFAQAPIDLDSIGKTAVSIRLDSDVIEFFKGYGRGYQTRINRVLRQYKDQVVRGAGHAAPTAVVRHASTGRLTTATRRTGTVKAGARKTRSKAR